MFFMTFLFVGIGLVTAQTSRVTGVVTAEEDGLPVVVPPYWWWHYSWYYHGY